MRTPKMPDRPAQSRPQRVVRGTLLAILMLGLIAGLYSIAITPPTPDSWYPKCHFYQFTGLHCPGCGTGRAAHFALNGQLLTAARLNIFAVIALPIIAILTIRRTLAEAFGHKVRRRVIPAWSIWLLFAAIMLFWILRNIPVYPFTLLAPFEL